MLASNLNLIYFLCIGLTHLFLNNKEECDADEAKYYELDEDDDALEEALTEETAQTLNAIDFVNKYPEHCIPKIDVSATNKILIVEYAPRFFYESSKRYGV